MSLIRAARPLAHAVPSCSRASSTTTTPWRSKTHIRRPSGLPNPLPALYAQRVVLADGSTFVAHTTSPTPAIIRLTRDVTNNPLWAPGTGKRGASEEAEDGRVGRFRRRFAAAEASELEAAAAEDGAAEGVSAPARSQAFRDEDLSWMSEGAEEEKLSAKQRAGPVKSKKKK